MKSIMECVEIEDIEEVKALLRSGVSPDSNDSSLYSEDSAPVFLVVDILNQRRINNLPYSMELLEILLQANCDLSVTMSGQTPREWAVEFEFDEAVDLIDTYSRPSKLLETTLEQGGVAHAVRTKEPHQHESLGLPHHEARSHT